MKYPKEEHLIAAVQEAFTSCRANDDDKDLMVSLADLIQQHGDIICRIILQIIVSIDLSPDKAMECWDNIVGHQARMSVALGRQIRLLPAACDYLSEFADEPHELKLVDDISFQQVVNDSTHDPLTGIYNRNYFDKSLEQQVSLARRHDNELSIVFLDVDNFKDVNDSFGHHAGDKTLQIICRVVSKQKRQTDIFARFGGEEFILLLPHTGNIEALILAERIREKIGQQVISSNGDSFSVTISGGIASFPVNGQSVDDLLLCADSALYQAKGAGKDNIAQYKMDKRRYLRVGFVQQIKIKALGFQEAEQFSGRSKDICSGGILFENFQPLAIGLRIQVSIPMQNVEPLLLIGTVVRVEAFAEDRYDIGMSISFKEMEKIANHEIAGFLKQERYSE